VLFCWILKIENIRYLFRVFSPTAHIVFDRVYLINLQELKYILNQLLIFNEKILIEARMSFVKTSKIYCVWKIFSPTFMERIKYNVD